MAETKTCEECGDNIVIPGPEEQVVDDVAGTEVYPGGRYRCRRCL
jgi:hypothetical protein